jgi:MFS family permease
VKRKIKFEGMQAFITIWFGQLVSLVGTGLTGFVLGLWVYQNTGSVTKYTIISLATVLPGIVISPFSGVLVDRYDRRKIMLISNIICTASIAAIAYLFYCGNLKIWVIYVSMGINSLCNAFQIASYTSSISVLVPKKHLVRANGLIQTSEGISRLVAPTLAGFLFLKLQVWGVLCIDFFTFIISIISCLIVTIPRIEKSVPEKLEASFFKELKFGWQYIKVRTGLMILLILMALVNYFVATVSVLATPLALSFTTPEVLGTALSISGCGMIFGSVLISIWGGPKQRIPAILSCVFFIGLFLMTAGLSPSIVLVTISAFFIMFFVPMQQSCSNAMWQSKVELSVQGRVFSMRRMIAQAAIPLAYLMSGPLSEKVFTPLMNSHAVSSTIGRVIGVGKGREIGLMFICMGILAMTVACVGFLLPRLRNVEQELPDVIPDNATINF